MFLILLACFALRIMLSATRNPFLSQAWPSCAAAAFLTPSSAKGSGPNSNGLDSESDRSGSFWGAEGIEDPILLHFRGSTLEAMCRSSVLAFSTLTEQLCNLRATPSTPFTLLASFLRTAALPVIVRKKCYNRGSKKTSEAFTSMELNCNSDRWNYTEKSWSQEKRLWTNATSLPCRACMTLCA